jgi:ferredoxin
MKYLAKVTTLQYAPDKCAGCGRCVEVCPQGVFVMLDKRASVTDRDLCMECGACAMNCEFGALSVNSGVACAAALINSMVTGGPPSCGCDSTAAGCCG